MSFPVANIEITDEMKSAYRERCLFSLNTSACQVCHIKKLRAGSACTTSPHMYNAVNTMTLRLVDKRGGAHPCPGRSKERTVRFPTGSKCECKPVVNSPQRQSRDSDGRAAR